MSNNSIEPDLLVEAAENLLAADEALGIWEGAGSFSHKMSNVTRCQENLDYIIHELGKDGIGKLGNLSLVFTHAVVFRAVSRKLYQSRTPTPLTKERKRYWYKRKDEAKRMLTKAIKAWYDDEAVKSGKTIVYHLMLKRNGHSQSVLSSTDRTYIKIEYDDAFRKMGQGEMYFVAKEYVDLKQKQEENGKVR